MHILLGVLSGFRKDLKLILDSSYGWSTPSSFGMGSYGSKKTDNVVADTVDFSTIMLKDFAVLRLHGGTGALVAGVVATFILVFLAYKIFLWKRAKMGAGRRAPQGEERAVWGGPGRMDNEDRAGLGRFNRRLPTAFRPAAVLPLPAHVDVCEDCREDAAYDVLRGHFQPPPVHPV